MLRFTALHLRNEDSVTTHTPAPALDSDLLTTDQAAELIGGVTRRTLQNWAATGRGPKRVRIGPRLVRYRADDIQEWLTNQYI